jgi:hypothetical protein
LGDYVRPGFNSEDMHRVIPDPNWLQDATLSMFGGGTGRFPFTIEGAHFYLELFPGPDVRTDRMYWRVDFTLTTGRPDQVVSVEEAAAFLRGKLADRTVRIQESIMMYHLPQTDYGHVEELHNRRGVGIRVSPGGWFD